MHYRLNGKLDKYVKWAADIQKVHNFCQMAVVAPNGFECPDSMRFACFVWQMCCISIEDAISSAERSKTTI